METIIVSNEIITAKSLVVNLIEKVNELDEVTVGKILSGDLSSDINNSDLERPVNFYDLGIPGYTGKPKTQSERRLHEANGDGVNYKVLIKQVLSGRAPIKPIINAISGRTKMLKQRVKLESDELLIYSIKAKLSEDFFSINPLAKELQMDFFYFCSEDENFSEGREDKSDIEVFQFLKEKYLVYKINLNKK